MIQFGITGYTGSLGKIFTKSNKNIRYIFFKGDIRKKKDVNKSDAILIARFYNETRFKEETK
jgi:hypothetical protein